MRLICHFSHAGGPAIVLRFLACRAYLTPLLWHKTLSGPITRAELGRRFRHHPAAFPQDVPSPLSGTLTKDNRCQSVGNEPNRHHLSFSEHTHRIQNPRTGSDDEGGIISGFQPPPEG